MAKKKVTSRAEDEAAGKKKVTRESARKKRSMPWRIPAIVLWLLAIGFEIAAFFMLDRGFTTMLIIFLVADAACVIAGSLLWKKANRISPCTSDSKFVCFLWNQMGVIATLLAFLPIGIFLLMRADNLTPKMKKVLAAVFSVLVLGSIAASIDYAPPTLESVQEAEVAAAASGEFDGTVFWTRFGKSYHLDDACPTLSRTRAEDLFSGTITQAFEWNRDDPCDFCAGGDQAHDEAEGVVDEAVDDAELEEPLELPSAEEIDEILGEEDEAA